jgi:MerR family transcriptional regulator, light-induced transcriptional regulator
MSDFRHSMKSVSQRTGLSPHVIRVWERRYGAVEPRRTPTNRRLYSETEVGRLALLCAATRAGHSIGTIARLPDEQLRVLAGWARNGEGEEGQTDEGPVAPVDDSYLAGAVAAVRRMDGRVLESVLRRASLELGTQGLLQRVVGPLTQRMGELWHQGELTAAQEHFASGLLRGFLANLARPYGLSEHAPGLWVGTPAGQIHELGAILVAAAASGHGWRAAYVGSSLPAVEIAGSAVRMKARAVALSIVYPGDDPSLGAELEGLRRFLPPATAIVVGGRAAECYRSALERIGAYVAKDLNGLYRVLDELRTPDRTAVPAG